MHTAARAPWPLLTTTFWSLATAGLVVLVACSSTSTPSGEPAKDDDEPTENVRDAGPRDSGNSPADASSGRDAGPDATADAASAPDAGTITEILGTLTGVCPALDGLLASSAPGLVDNRVVFVPGESFTRDTLSPGGKHLYDTPNAGGSSSESEIVAFEVLHYCDGASLYKTETEV